MSLKVISFIISYKIRRMKTSEFRKYAHEVADWMADFYEDIESYPVKSSVKPGEIIARLPAHPPKKGEDFARLMKDVDEKILPGMTHWQSPNFFAYFPANSSFPSVLAEMVTATLGAQCMVWDTSPAAAELEELVMNWLKEMTGLPASFHGVIQDSASTATLVAMLSARERISDFQVNEIGFLTNKYRVYCSTEAHSSIDKAVKIAGFGQQSLVRIDVDDRLRIIPEKLEEAIQADIMEGLIPACVVAALGTTGTVAIDPLLPLSRICKKYKVWLHIDAAYAGTALVLENHRQMIEGIEDADSFVFNPHKWMFTNFDCSAYFVKDKGQLIRTFEIMPEYLKTKNDLVVNNYRDWGIQLGRRFRALKLWFVIRTMGTEGIKEKVASHIAIAAELAKFVREEKNFELLEPQNLGLVCFRLKPADMPDGENLNRLNREFLEHLNGSGKLYLSHTSVRGNMTLRLVVGQTYVTRSHVIQAWNFIIQESKKFIL